MPDWPIKTRELRSHHFDSTAWNDFRFRDDDIVIATYAKSGTTCAIRSLRPKYSACNASVIKGRCSACCGRGGCWACGGACHWAWRWVS